MFCFSLTHTLHTEREYIILATINLYFLAEKQINGAIPNNKHDNGCVLRFNKLEMFYV